MKLRNVFLAMSAVMMTACSSAESSAPEVENTGEVSQALVVIDEWSPVLDSSTVPPGQNMFWQSSVGPDGWGNDNPYTEHQDSPGICGITYIGGGFRGLIDDNAFTPTGASVRMIPTGYYGQQRWTLNVKSDPYGGGFPKARMHCVSLSKFSNVRSAPGGLGNTIYATAGEYRNFNNTAYSAASETRQLNIWSGVYGGMATAPLDRAIFSKFFRSGSNHFTVDYTTGVQDRVVSGNTGGTGTCPTVQAGYPTNCLTETFGHSMYKVNFSGLNVAWTRAITDNVASVPAGGTTASISATASYSQNFCFLSGIGGSFRPTAASADIWPAVNPISGQNVIKLVVTGAGAEAAFSCVPYLQGPNG